MWPSAQDMEESLVGIQKGRGQEENSHPRSSGSLKRLQIVIHIELRRMGNLLHLPKLRPFPGHPDIDQPLGEYVALCEVLVVGLQGVQGLAQDLGSPSIFFCSSGERV